MYYQHVAAVTAAGFLCASGMASAQDAATAQAPAQPAAPASITVPARTVLQLEILDAVNSKDNSPGQSFRFRLAEPLTIDGRVLIPAGTPGVGEVVHAARARAMGKAGELILAARYLEHDGRRIALRTLRFGSSQGLDNSGALTTLNVVAAATVPVASLVAIGISGGEVRVPAGARATAQTSAEMVLTPLD